MSSICGIFRTGGAAVHAAEIESMLNALDHWRADARGQWIGRGVGLGHLLLRTAPAPAQEGLPTYLSEADLAITGDLRLDNRLELSSALGIAASELDSWTDGKLVLRAYREWAEACVDHLLGDFAFSIWNGRQRQLYCVRDPFGVKPFYYSQSNVAGHAVLAFASELKGLLTLPHIDTSPNETWIGDYLHGLALEVVDTFYSGIKRLAPGHALTMDANGLRIRKYWEFDRHRELHLARDEDYIEAFREKFQLAVRRRLQTPLTVGAELSGGLDSCGICAVAQQALRDAGRPFYTFSQVRPDDQDDIDWLPGDARWAVELLCQHSGITHNYLLKGEGGITPALEWALRHYDEPPRNFVSFFNDDLYDSAARHGVTVLLSGFGGNQGVSAVAGERRRELFYQGRWSELHQDLVVTTDAKRRLVRWSRLIARECSWPVRPWLDRIFQQTPLWQKHAYRASRQDFAKRIGMGERAFRYSKMAREHATVRSETIRLLNQPENSQRLDYAAASTTARRMEYRYPLLDTELVALYLALPSHLKHQHGVGRYAFRRSIEAWVPHEICWHAGPRASANPGCLLRKRRDRNTLLARLHELPPDDQVFNYVDPRKLAIEKTIRHARGSRQWERNTELLMALILQHKLGNGHRNSA